LEEIYQACDDFGSGSTDGVCSKVIFGFCYFILVLCISLTDDHHSVSDSVDQLSGCLALLHIQVGQSLNYEIFV